MSKESTIQPGVAVEGVYFFDPVEESRVLGPYDTISGCKRAAGRANLSGQVLRCRVTTEILDSEEYVAPAAR